MTTLYACQQGGISFGDAWHAVCPLFQAGKMSATALLYTPLRCILGRMTENGQLEGPVMAASGAPTGVEPLRTFNDVFEARVFSAHLELRWLHSIDGLGIGVLLAESPTSLLGWDQLPVRSSHEVLDQKYLLWGKGARHALKGGWGVVAEARIGALPVPLPVAELDRVVLETREYLAEVDSFGNVSVIEERLIGLSIANSSKNVADMGEPAHG